MQNQKPFPELASRPVVLRVAGTWRLLGYLGVVLFFCLAIYLVVLASGSRYGSSAFIMLMSAALVAVVMVACLLALSRGRVVLQNDSLRIYDAIGYKEIPFNQVAGVRELASQNRSILRFVLADPDVKDINVALHFERKEEFVFWAYATFEVLDGGDSMEASGAVLPNASKSPGP